MRTRKLGASALEVSRIAYGCWRIAGSEGGPPLSPDTGERAVLAAADAGFTLFDLADIYGGGECEIRFGKALRARPGLRDRITIATKCGIRRPGDPDPAAPYRYDFGPDYILQSVEGSLRRLGVDSVDLLLLHRPDYLMQPDEVAGAFAVLHDAGKVREFGLSNFKPSQWSVLQSRLSRPLVTHQVRFSLAHQEAMDDGTLDQCLGEGVTPTAWSPLAGGSLLHTAPEDVDSRALGLLKELAEAHGATPMAVALAWLGFHPAGVIPIIGTTRPDRIAAAAQADEIRLSREEWYSLVEAARGARLP